MTEIRRFLPWLDRKGRLSPLKLGVFIALFVPGLWTAAAFWQGTLGPRPLTEAIHEIGLWAIRLLFVSLAITPARALLQWPQLLAVRRMIGVAAFAYAASHLVLYAADQAFDLRKVITEIALRIYLTIGFSALLGLSALAATSTDAMIRRLGSGRWRRLHRFAYAIALLATIHFFMQSKDDVTEPTLMAGLFGWLMAYRVLAWVCRGRPVPVTAILLLGISAGAVTALAEALYFFLKMGADPRLVLAANLSVDLGLRPAVYVLIAGLLCAAAAALRAISIPAKWRVRSA